MLHTRQAWLRTPSTVREFDLHEHACIPDRVRSLSNFSPGRSPTIQRSADRYPRGCELVDGGQQAHMIYRMHFPMPSQMATGIDTLRDVRGKRTTSYVVVKAIKLCTRILRLQTASPNSIQRIKTLASPLQRDQRTRDWRGSARVWLCCSENVM